MSTELAIIPDSLGCLVSEDAKQMLLRADEKTESFALFDELQRTKAELKGEEKAVEDVYFIKLMPKGVCLAEDGKVIAADDQASAWDTSNGQGADGLPRNKKGLWKTLYRLDKLDFATAVRYAVLTSYVSLPGTQHLAADALEEDDEFDLDKGNPDSMHASKRRRLLSQLTRAQTRPETPQKALQMPFHTTPRKTPPNLDSLVVVQTEIKGQNGVEWAVQDVRSLKTRMQDVLQPESRDHEYDEFGTLPETHIDSRTEQVLHAVSNLLPEITALPSDMQTEPRDNLNTRFWRLMVYCLLTSWQTSKEYLGDKGGTCVNNDMSQRFYLALHNANDHVDIQMLFDEHARYPKTSTIAKVQAVLESFSRDVIGSNHVAEFDEMKWSRTTIGSLRTAMRTLGNNGCTSQKLLGLLKGTRYFETVRNASLEWVHNYAQQYIEDRIFVHKEQTWEEIRQTNAHGSSLATKFEEDWASCDCTGCVACKAGDKWLTRGENEYDGYPENSLRIHCDTWCKTLDKIESPSFLCPTCTRETAQEEDSEEADDDFVIPDDEFSEDDSISSQDEPMYQ